jgi:hypothetical protein
LNGSKNLKKKLIVYWYNNDQVSRIIASFILESIAFLILSLVLLHLFRDAECVALSLQKTLANMGKTGHDQSQRHVYALQKMICHMHFSQIGIKIRQLSLSSWRATPPDQGWLVHSPIPIYI